MKNEYSFLGKRIFVLEKTDIRFGKNGYSFLGKYKIRVSYL